MKPTSLKRNSFYENLYQLDRILRGDATRPEHLKKAEIEIPIVGISLTIICLAIVYGFCMGVFALVRGFENSAYASALMQTSASMCKVPLLFMLTLLVTFPSLYVFNALAGSKLKMVPVLKLLIASLSVNIAVLASMGPILAFFSLSTPNYQFIVLLNVIVFAVAGILGLVFLIQTLGRLTDQASEKTKLNLGSAATVGPLPTDVHRPPDSLP
jgi:succinate dehydrogenase/fumarate reductase cytochrome b subunit